MCHFRNQRAAAVRVHIGANAVGDAHFANPGKLLQALEKLPRVQAEPQLQEKTSGDGSLQFARSSQGDHPAVVDDGKALAERVGFFMLCVVSRMVLPVWLFSRTISHRSKRVCGSRPALGSFKN